jgi:hypothetical protein
MLTKKQWNFFTRFLRFLRYVWRFLNDPPYHLGKRVEILPDLDTKYWLWMYPQPLSIVKVETTPYNWGIEEGFLYTLKTGDGRLITFHEKWVTALLYSQLSREKKYGVHQLEG